MPLNPRRMVLAFGCLGVALLAALPVLMRTESRAARETSPTPSAPTVAVAPAIQFPAAPAVAIEQVAAAPQTRAKAHHAKATTAQSTVAQSGMMIYLDPETGELRQEPSDPLPTESTPLPVERTADSRLHQEDSPSGGTRVDLDDTFHEMSFVRIDASGRLVIGCLPATEVAKTLNAKPAAPAADWPTE